MKFEQFMIIFYSTNTPPFPISQPITPPPTLAHPKLKRPNQTMNTSLYTEFAPPRHIKQISCLLVPPTTKLNAPPTLVTAPHVSALPHN